MIVVTNYNTHFSKRVYFNNLIRFCLCKNFCAFLDKIKNQFPDQIQDNIKLLLPGSMKNRIEISDNELLSLLTLENSIFAFEEIYNRYWEKLCDAAYKRTHSNEVAEELVQDLFADVWMRRNSLNINAILPVYLYTAIRYRVVNYVQREMVKNSYEQQLVLTNHYFDNSTEEIVVASDLNHQIKIQVELLPIKCREVFELSRNEHKSNKEIARSLGISEKTVENHITRALRRLRVSVNTFLFL